MIALGFFLGSFLVWQKAREEYFEEDLLMDGILLTALISLTASRIGFFLLQPDNFKGLTSFFNFVTRPGFSWQAALLGGIAGLVFYCQKKKWDFYKLADLAVFGLVLGLILAKIGFFLANFIFDEFSSLTALAEAALLIVVYRLLLVFSRNYRLYKWYQNKRGEANPGFLFLTFLILTSFIHLVVQGVKPDGFHFGPVQLIDLLIILTSLVLFSCRSGRGLTIAGRSFKNKERQLKKNKEDYRFKTGMEAK